MTDKSETTTRGRVMATLSKDMMRIILKQLDLALVQTRKHDVQGTECMASCHIRIARDRLLEVAIADVEIEQLEAKP